jgi:metal-dependent amidase/aminoacylase/carboxypeptidase family protein
LPGIGHACGHNLIAVGSLGAALATKAWLEEDPSRKGTVKLFGTPVPPQSPKSLAAYMLHVCLHNVEGVDGVLELTDRAKRAEGERSILSTLDIIKTSMS